MSTKPDDEALFDAITAGASGFVLKQILGGELVNAVRTAASGQSPLDAKPTSALRPLTDREHTVLDLIGEGLADRQIAERMFPAEKAVKNHVSHLLAGLGMRRRTRAAVFSSRLRKPGRVSTDE